MEADNVYWNEDFSVLPHLKDLMDNKPGLEKSDSCYDSDDHEEDNNHADVNGPRSLKVCTFNAIIVHII